MTVTTTAFEDAAIEREARAHLRREPSREDLAMSSARHMHLLRKADATLDRIEHLLAAVGLEVDGHEELPMALARLIERLGKETSYATALSCELADLRDAARRSPR